MVVVTMVIAKIPKGVKFRATIPLVLVSTPALTAIVLIHARMMMIAAKANIVPAVFVHPTARVMDPVLRARPASVQDAVFRAVAALRTVVGEPLAKKHSAHVSLLEPSL